MPARLARVLLLLALLAGWQAALQHPIEHVDELGEFVHLDGGHSDERSPLCDALAALTVCAPEAVQPPVASEQFEYSLPVRHPGTPRVAQAPPFLSQGPPFASV